MTKPSSEISTNEKIVIGGTAGAAEALFNHPLWMTKIRLQNREPITFNPNILYRGVLLDMASNVPITAFQVTLNDHIQKTFFLNHSELSNKQKILSAFGAGLGTSLLICPTEMIMTWQGKTGYSFRVTSNYLISQGGLFSLFSALPATGARDAVCSTYLLWFVPALKAAMQPYYPNDYAASLISGIIAGFSATIMTQAIDTVKTIQQSSSPSILYSFPAAVKKIKKEEGFFGFFRGTIPRSINTIFTMIIMGWTIEKMETALKRRKAKH